MTAYLLFFITLTFLFIFGRLHCEDLFDGVPLTANAVCFSTEDCNRYEQQGPENQKPSKALPPPPPLFCRPSDLQCLCNRQQLHDHTDQEMSQLLSMCLPCTQSSETSSNDPCTALDPYSFCNSSSTLCECNSNIDSSKTLNSLKTSVCFHYAHPKNGSSHQHLPQMTTFVRPEPFSEWFLSLLLAYILPSCVILTVVYFLYKQGCFSCGCKKGEDGPDSEMVLYRQL